MTCFIDLVKPQTKKYTRYLFETILLLLGSFFIASMAQISIPLWFTPVPITMQTFALAMIAGLLGAKRSVAITILYLAEGAMGLPVFAGGAAGYLHFVGPTGGYLLGFILYVYVVGTLLEKGWKDRFLSTFFAMVLGSALLYVCGVFYLSLFVGGLTKAFSAGVYPFLPGDLFKTLSACTLLSLGWKWVKK